MLDQMIESKSNGRENARKSRYLLVTFGAFCALLLGGWTYSLFAKSYGVGGGDFEISSLVSPVAVENETPPARPEPQKNVSRASNKVILEDLYDDLWHSTAPDSTLGKKNVVSARIYDPKNVVIGDRNVIPENAGRNIGNDDLGCGLCDNNPTGKRPESRDPEFDDVVKTKPTPTVAPTPNRPISLGPVNGKATYLPKPAYSEAAKAIRASGQVQVQVTIDETGNVTSATAVSGHPLLRGASVEAARISKFTPTLLGGRPVRVTGIIIYNFLPR